MNSPKTGPSSTVSWSRSVMPTLAALWLAGTSAPAHGACTLVWGPSHECLMHGELAKEGLAVDSQDRSFSVGYTDRFGLTSTDALLMVRDASGALLSLTQWNVPLTQNNFAAGVWVSPAGTQAITVGTCRTGNLANPGNLVITRWTPGPGVPWSNPVPSATTVLAPGALGLVGSETWGCRVIEASPTDLFVSGCTDQEIFVIRVDKATLGVVSTWGIGGVRSVAAPSPNATATCPAHDTPGALGWFLAYPQAFIETVSDRLYLGGTLLANGIDHDFVVGCFKVPTGAFELPFGVRWSGGVGDEFMKAMAATTGGVYAVGTRDPQANPQMELVAWQPNGVIRNPGLVTMPGPSRGNDVEAVTVKGRCQVVVGGYGITSLGFATGTIWHFRHQVASGFPLQQPPTWAGVNGIGPNPQAYGPSSDPGDEVFDLGLGTGTRLGEVYATGQALLAPGAYGQPLACIAPNGALSFSNNPNPLAPLPDRGVAVEFRSPGSGSVFTHGTADDTLGGFWNCPGHFVSRHTRFQP